MYSGKPDSSPWCRLPSELSQQNTFCWNVYLQGQSESVWICWPTTRRLRSQIMPNVYRIWLRCNLCYDSVDISDLLSFSLILNFSIADHKAQLQSLTCILVCFVWSWIAVLQIRKYLSSKEDIDCCLTIYFKLLIGYVI